MLPQPTRVFAFASFEPPAFDLPGLVDPPAVAPLRLRFRRDNYSLAAHKSHCALAVGIFAPCDHQERRLDHGFGSADCHSTGSVQCAKTRLVKAWSTLFAINRCYRVIDRPGRARSFNHLVGASE